MTSARVKPFLLGLVAVAIAAISFFWFSGARAVVSCALGWTMLAIAASDAENFRIPDALSLPCIPLGVVAAYVLDASGGGATVILRQSVAALFGGLLLYAVREGYYYWRNREGLGLGDVKLGAVAGAWTGFQGTTNVILLGCIFALVCVTILTLSKRRAFNATMELPLGVFLAPAIWMVWVSSGLAGVA